MGGGVGDLSFSDECRCYGRVQFKTHDGDTEEMPAGEWVAIEEAVEGGRHSLGHGRRPPWPHDRKRPSGSAHF